MNKTDFISNLVTGLILICAAVLTWIFYKENIGSIIAFGIIGVAYLFICYFQFNNKS